MQRMRMRKTAAGPEGVFAAGDIVYVPDDLAKTYIDGGYAEYATLARPERAVARPQRRQPMPAIPEEIAQKLASAGITAENLAETADRDLLAIPGIGQATLRKIRATGGGG